MTGQFTAFSSAPVFLTSPNPKTSMRTFKGPHYAWIDLFHRFTTTTIVCCYDHSHALKVFFFCIRKKVVVGINFVRKSCPTTVNAELLVYLNNQNLCLLADHLLHSHDLYDTSSSVIVRRNWLFPTLYNGQLTPPTSLLMRPLFCCPKKVIHFFFRRNTTFWSNHLLFLSRFKCLVRISRAINLTDKHKS